MNRSFPTLFAFATVVLSVACRKDDMPVRTTSSGEANTSPSADSADARGHSLVRVVNAFNDGTNVAVQLGEETLFRDVKPGAVTDYREISSNLANFSVRPAGASNGTMLANNDQFLVDGNRYTVFLVKEDLSTNTLRIVKDEVIPDSGKARIRVLHAASGAPELDVSIVGTKQKLFSAVTFKSQAGYVDIDPATVTLEVRAKDSPTVLLRIRDVDLKKGTATTVVFTGAAKLNSFTFTDAVMAPTPKT
jgi:hypothetical protein